MKSIIAVEMLSFSIIWKLLLLLKKHNVDGVIYFVESNRYQYFLANFIFQFFSIKLVKMDFIFDELNDSNGTNLGFKKIEKDLSEIWSILVRKKYLNEKDSLFQGYLKKLMLSQHWPSSSVEKTLRNILLMLCAFSEKIKDKDSNNNLFIMDKRLWKNEIRSYGSNLDIDILFINIYPLKKIKSTIINYIKSNQLIRFINVNLRWRLLNKVYNKISLREISKDGSKIIIDQMMQYFKASTFWDSGALSNNDLIFVTKDYLMDKEELYDIKNSGMEFMALSSNIAKSLDLPLYLGKHSFFKYKNFNANLKHEEKNILNNEISYFRDKNYWIDFFKVTRAKIYVSHFKWSANFIPAAAAIKEVGGVSALWYTSYYEFPYPQSSIYSDIYFSFSPAIKNCEKINNSKIKYIISTGYPFDHRFMNLKPKANIIRNQLTKHGAKKIISLFDGGAKSDQRWSVGISNYRKDYQFWLQKLLDEKWLGLILKAKSPGSLRKRLGASSSLLDDAIETGRCYFSEKTNYNDKNIYSRPAEAALASDIAIHCCLYAGSAGLEAGLAGTPTLFYDRFKLKNSQFYNLKNVVFDDWEILWVTLKEHLLKKPKEGFGDWSQIINDLDPFRDGKASYRIGEYLNWLNEGFKMGFDREKNMNYAAENYSTKWGAENVIHFS
tara:strand:+ start:3537 stop:5531 length:1995 start_codon:yes stop_codon:yes gene_type:complete